MTRWADDVVNDLGRNGIVATRDSPLGARTTYRVGGHAAVLVEVGNAEQLSAIASVARGHDVLVLGQGSNTLVCDEGFDGIAVILDARDAEERLQFESSGDERWVSAPAGVRLPVLARRSAAMNMCGLEWMVGVPGSVGGAVRMNAGGHGADVRDALIDVDIINISTGRRRTVAADDVGLRFRGSALADHHVVVTARFALHVPRVHESGTCEDELAAIVRWRRDHQPGGQNAGSVFVNPGTDDRSAGALIDSAGMRGFSVGTATVSEKHGNFIQSQPGGSAADVVRVMCAVQDAVERVHGIVLRSEIRLVGCDADTTQRFAVHDHYDVDDARILASQARLESLV